MITEGPKLSFFEKAIKSNIAHLIAPGGWWIVRVPTGGYDLVLQLAALTHGPDTIPELIAQVNNILPLNYCEIQGPGSNRDRVSVAAVEATFSVVSCAEGRADKAHRTVVNEQKRRPG